eukprot:CAMPEP_0180405060 /NCGR_PEP_ID=MMETSP0989-20121125/40384_1 /TAXON_ID=697907 /ORGANISM="non described non described, Strain CCMP2293" /LENGTH=112 /DNA_ID=CAMNT_0022408591 /DNA_START=210 /DNA_END=543 /DNA_ORIENTATION=+
MTPGVSMRKEGGSWQNWMVATWRVTPGRAPVIATLGRAASPLAAPTRRSWLMRVDLPVVRDPGDHHQQRSVQSFYHPSFVESLREQIPAPSQRPGENDVVALPFQVRCPAGL